jgi:GTPase SAR1 family protein
MKGNILGDIRAENDTAMLDQAFLETSDYKTLLESTDRCVVVGRRGTGKSALVHKLNQHWRNQNQTFVVVVAPEEDQIIGLRGLLNVFGNNFVHIKAGAKIAWRYALYMEVIVRLDGHYKHHKLIDQSKLSSHLKEWIGSRQNVTTKLRNKLRTILKNDLSPEENIADLSSNLGLDDVEIALHEILERSNHKFILLIDRLDEGYTPDGMGVALVDGFVQAVIDLNSKFSNNVFGLVFLRDNMYRSIAINDPDFTRNIEGQVLRLHWDDYGLFNLVCNRLRVAHKDGQENNTRLWNSYSARELRGREGFRLALRLTLYRPRDILVLLNNSFLHAASQNRKEIILEDIESSAKSISENRLYDLHKEYESIFPALNLFTAAFNSGPSEISIKNAQLIIDMVLEKDDHDIVVQRDIAIFENSTQVLQRLYGIGFIGIYDEKASSFVFCHDGRDPAKEILANSKLLIHPCYWLALNLTEKTLDIDQAENIYDEYDIEISSISDEQRQARIGQIIEEIKDIEHGSSGCHSFEEWCLQAIKLIFAGALSNVELHPNKSGRQQRDIVATNMTVVPVWKRIFQDYGTRQIVFEIKNYVDLSADEYRQMNTYLCNDYGRLGFIITRASDNNLEKGKELDWTQELYFNQGKKIVIKLSEKYLLKHLSKLRNPQKHDAANVELNKLIDTYIRQYLILKSK